MEAGRGFGRWSRRNGRLRGEVLFLAAAICRAFSPIFLSCLYPGFTPGWSLRGRWPPERCSRLGGWCSLRCMKLDFGTRRGVALAVMAVALVAGAAVNSAARAQTSIAITEPSAPLLPETFGEWKKAETSGDTPSYSLVNVSKDALEECGPQRSAVAEYTRAGRDVHGGPDVHIEAIQFGDRTGAYSAFTLIERPGMTVGKGLGSVEMVGAAPSSVGAVLFLQGTTVALANFGGAVTDGDIATLRPLADALPKVFGNKGIAPLLPTMVPVKGRVSGSVRYALGPVSYAAEGGVLPANSLSWDKEAEAVTAQYEDARGKETLTVLLYPTPTIAEAVTKTVQGDLGSGLEGKLGVTKLRREGALVLLASGSFAADEAQRMVENIHLQEMTFNQDVQPTFHIAAVQTFSLLTNIAILSGVLMAAAVLLGLFLGVGRATFRVMRGKPAAAEPEFLSLHLSPQNEPAKFYPKDSPEQR